MGKRSNEPLPEFDFQLSRKARGSYNSNRIKFKRGDEPYKGSIGFLRLKSRKGGDKVTAKIFSDINGDGRFSKDEIIFKGSAMKNGIYDQLNGSSGKIRWDYDDCTPCLRQPFNTLTLNPTGSEKVEFFQVGFLENINGFDLVQNVM